MTEQVDDEVAARLQQAEQRYTRGRRSLVAALRDGTGPMTIPQILTAGDGLTQSSAYRNLAVLEEVGAVTRVITNDDFARFELAEDLTGHHHHLICESCGDVDDVELAPSTEQRLDQTLAAVADEAGFTLRDHRLDLIGVCADCR